MVLPKVNKYVRFLIIFIALLALELGFSFLLSDNSAIFEKKKIVLFTALSVSVLLTLLPPKNWKQLFISFFPLLLSYSTLIVKPLSGEHLSATEIYISVGFLTSIYTSLLFISLFFFHKILSRCYAIVVTLLFLVPSTAIWFYYFISSSFLHTDSILAVLQTNIAEAASFFVDHITISGLICLVLFFVITYISAKGISTLSAKPIYKYKNKHTVLLSILFLIFSSYLLSHTLTKDNNIFYALYKGTQAYTQKYANFSKKKTERESRIHEIIPAADSQNKGVYVLVIGESQNRLHMHAYSYDRDTTPWLDKEKEDPDCLLFTNAYSCHTHTVPVLTYALTAKNQYNQLQLEDAVSLLEVAKAAGYNTAWISNQVQYSAWDTPITIIASEADQQRWFNKNVGETTKTNFYDDKVISGLKSLTYSDHMLIIVHLMGNHGSYDDRYPKDFNIYHGQEKDIDSYDNSIRYNDWVVSQIYQTVKDIPYFQGMIYFSDHTDAIDQHLDHDCSQFVYPMTYIPFYMIFSPAYIQHNPNILTNLKNHQNTYFTNDLIFNTMLGIMHIQVPSLYEPQNDITTNTYDGSPERFMTLYGKKKIIDKDK